MKIKNVDLDQTALVGTIRNAFMHACMQKCMPTYIHTYIHKYWSSVVECLTRDGGAVGLSLTGVIALCS